MRNLKKILALVLALIMSLSLMATAGAGSFQDVTDDNPYKTAIDVLDELKVFQGYKEDGTFRPTETLNRAQAAVLVYRVATGDVEDKYVENYTYMAQSKFNDLDGYNWAKGYINYCQNAKIVVGTSATTFSPEAPVTGYQLMVMLLRTLGYGAAGEFTDPKGWELETAKIAEREGLLKNVTGGDFGNPAPRQMVAEILFRGLLHDTVQYSPLTPNGYTESGEILGKRVGLEEVTGVVVANEWANLEGSKPLAEGKTILKVDGKNRTIDVSSTGADLGTSVHAYLKGATVLAPVEDSGDNVIKTNEGAETTVKKLQGELDITDDTEYFVNYGETTRDVSEYRIKYVLKFDDLDDAKTAAKKINDASGETKAPGLAVVDEDDVEVSRVITPGKTITSVDMDNIEDIFSKADYISGMVDGEVYVGSQSQTDISDVESDDFKYSFSKFVKEFINDAEEPFSDAAQGESLRIIDNNGDGVADYVLKVEFVMTTITDYDKKTDTYYVEYDKALSDKVETPIKASAIKAMDGEIDLTTDAVVLYSLIDGVYYAKNPEVSTMTIDKKGIDTKNDTFTVDGEDHIWSGIDREAIHYYDELKELVEGVKYDFHLDYFGNARLANEANKGFVLLTDAYYWSNRHESTTKVELYDVDQEKLVEADANDWDLDTNKSGFFIDQNANSDRIDDAWLRLNTFGMTYPKVDENNGRTYFHYTDDDTTVGWNTYVADPFRTNIAAYAKDGEAYDLYSVEENTLLKRDDKYNTYEIAGTKNGTACSLAKNGSVSAKDNTLYGIKSWSDAKTIDTVDRIMTTNQTTYYYVDWDSKGRVDTVTSWTGYGNVPETLGDFQPNRAYAVTYTSDSVSGYEVAEVVVFEGAYEKPVYDAWLVYAARGGDTRYEYSLGLQDDGTYGDDLTKLGVFKNMNIKSIDTPEKVLAFYDKDAKVITEDFNKYGVYVGEVNTRRNVNYRDYITFGLNNEVKEILLNDDMAEFRFNINTKKLDSHIDAVDAEDYTRLKDGNKVIFMLNAKGEVALVVNVDDTRDQNGDLIDLDEITALKDLYNTIKQDQENSEFNWIKKVNVVDANKVVLTESYVGLTQENRKITDNDRFKLVFGSNTIRDAITKIEAENAEAAEVDGEWYLFSIKGDVTLNITVAAATDKTLTTTFSSAADAAIRNNNTNPGGPIYWIKNGVKQAVFAGGTTLPVNTMVYFDLNGIDNATDWVITKTVNGKTTDVELTKTTGVGSARYTGSVEITDDMTINIDLKPVGAKSDKADIVKMTIRGVDVTISGDPTAHTVKNTGGAVVATRDLYTIKVSDGATVTDVLLTSNKTTEVVTDEKDKTLTKGDTFTVNVKAADGTLVQHTITVSPAATTATLKLVSNTDTSVIIGDLGSSTPKAGDLHLNYTKWYGETAENLKKAVTPTDANADYEVSTNSIGDGTTVTVTAEDGTTKGVYTVKFTRNITVVSGVTSDEKNITAFAAKSGSTPVKTPAADGTTGAMTFVAAVGSDFTIQCTISTDSAFTGHTTAVISPETGATVSTNEITVKTGTSDVSYTVTSKK